VERLLTFYQLKETRGSPTTRSWSSSIRRLIDGNLQLTARGHPAAPARSTSPTHFAEDERAAVSTSVDGVVLCRDGAAAIIARARSASSGAAPPARQAAVIGEV